MITKHFAPASPSFPDSFFFLRSLSEWCRRTGDGQLRVRSWSVWNISFLLPSSPHYSSMEPTPWDTVSHKVLQTGLSSCWSGPSRRDCTSMDPPWATVPARNLFLHELFGLQLPSGLILHLLSVGAPKLPRCVSPQCAPWWIAGGELASPLSKTTELLSCTTAVRG